MPRPLTHSLVACAFVFLSLVLTWPLAAHLSTHMPGAGVGDNVTFLWNFWWMREALASDARDFFQTTAIFHPFGANLTIHTHTALSAFVGATALSGLSIVAAQNVVLLASVALNGFATYLLALSATRRVGASVLAGLAFAAAPYFAGHIYGHFNLVPAWTLPLFCLVWLRALRTSSIASSILAGLTLALTAYNDYYYTVYLVGFMALTLVMWTRSISASLLRPVRGGAGQRVLAGLGVALITAAVAIDVTGGGRFSVGPLEVSATTGLNVRTAAWLVFMVWAWRRWRPRISLVRQAPAGSGPTWAWRTVVIACVTFLLAASPLLIGAVGVWMRGDYTSQAYSWRNAPAGIDVASLVSGHAFHPLWGGLVARWNQRMSIDPIEGTAWLGAATILILWSLRRQWWAEPVARPWIWTGAAFLTWALGPHLLVLGLRTGLLLPGILLRYLPVVANARIPGRAIVMVYLALSMLVAVALTRSKARTPYLVAIAVLLLVDLLPSPIPLVALDRPAAYVELGQRPPGAVLELPLGIRDGFGEVGRLDHRTLYYQTFHHQPIVGGFVARMPESLAHDVQASPTIRVLLELSRGGVVDASLRAAGLSAAPALLADRAVRYLMVDTRATSAELRAFVAQLPVERVFAAGGLELFVVRP